MPHSYFDHNATAPVAPSVLAEFTETLGTVFGNPSSIHQFGQAARQKIESARRQIAHALGTDPKDIVFTSGGTESDNLALFGVLRPRPGSHLVTTSIEHPAILNAAAQLEREGHQVTYLPVDGTGALNPSDVRNALRPHTALVSVMHANNETGVIQPVPEIAKIARQAGIPLHSDAVQTAGRIPLKVRELGTDLLSLSGHKFGATKGIGALYVRKGVKLHPILFGGRHERERRAGTENVTGAWAMGRAAEHAFDWSELAPLRDRLERGILERVPAVRVNGGGSPRLPNTTNLCFEGIEGEAMVIALDLRGFAVSSGSACSSGAVEPSHVLLAMGLSREDARSSVRFSLGPANTPRQVDDLIEAVADSVTHLRRISVAEVSHV